MKDRLEHRFRLTGPGFAWGRALAAALAGALLLLLASCSGGGRIVVTDAMARPAPLEGGAGGAFMTIRNETGQADRLSSAASPAAQSVELHETVDDNGVMRMVPQPDGWEVAPGERLALKPGGKHIMLLGLIRPLKAGDIIEVTLNFDKAGPVMIQVPVKEMTQSQQRKIPHSGWTALL
jgi:periplasmic copper chaperone A